MWGIWSAHPPLPAGQSGEQCALGRLLHGRLLEELRGEAGASVQVRTSGREEEREEGGRGRRKREREGP